MAAGSGFTRANISKMSSQRTTNGSPMWNILKILVIKNERSEEHTSELQSLMRISYAVFCLKKKPPTHIPTMVPAHSNIDCALHPAPHIQTLHTHTSTDSTTS